MHFMAHVATAIIFIQSLIFAAGRELNNHTLTFSFGYLCSREVDIACPLVKDSEPIRLLEIPTSPSLYMLVKYIEVFRTFINNSLLL